MQVTIEARGSLISLVSLVWIRELMPIPNMNFKKEEVIRCDYCAMWEQEKERQSRYTALGQNGPGHPKEIYIYIYI